MGFFSYGKKKGILENICGKKIEKYWILWEFLKKKIYQHWYGTIYRADGRHGIGYWRDNMKMLILPIKSSSVTRPIFILMASSIGRIVALGMRKIHEWFTRWKCILNVSLRGVVFYENGDHDWPPRSCDLTPVDFFLLGFLKSVVCANKPTTTQALKEEIGRCINEIPQHSCKTVIENFIKRSRACQQSRGGHLHEILFHT